MILVREKKMLSAHNPIDPITAVAAALHEHYGCPWRAAEDVAVRVRRIMIDSGWSILPPNAPADRPATAGMVRRDVGGLS
jgi:hypothetical protein